jgi:hypothetical protein
MELNVQETKELEYFQTIQVQRQQIKHLLLELGKAQAEIEHLKHMTRPIVVRQSKKKERCAELKKNYDRVLMQLMALKGTV